MKNYYKANNMGGKKTCRYYRTCGNSENCLRCLGYEKAGKEKKVKR